MTNQEMLANGPEGWTHFNEGDYFRSGAAYSDVYCKGEWVDITHEEVFSRSREDIERIVYLESVLKGEAK
ncbi:hypothetical protein JC525_09225 [Alteromonas sp. IB21]|uniref:hypothetical protein n=1 Tax=Alteromonas sp. IB21 TaxID=2779369 RepID=UPI0018E8E640|nr:hypothetical protein [Alteromonas sp. IB21]MBJ2129118.1 hypothetical protein [Alteromonas sp. IB21]